MKRYQNRSLLHCAKGEPCVLCGKNDGSTVPAHLPGALYGMASGTGQKTHDWLVAHVCNSPQQNGEPSCHEKLDTVWRKDTQIRMKALCLTLERLFAKHRISYGGKSE